jgi:hypothetical protein
LAARASSFLTISRRRRSLPKADQALGGWQIAFVLQLAPCPPQRTITFISVRPTKRFMKSSGPAFDRRPSQFVRRANKTFRLPTMTTGLPTDERCLDFSEQDSGQMAKN